MYSTPIILILAFVVLLVVVVRRARKRMPKQGSPVTKATVGVPMETFDARPKKKVN